MNWKLFFIAVMISFSACQQETKSDSFDKTRIAEEIRNVNNTIYLAGNEKNARKLYSHFSDSVTGVFNGIVLSSWEDHKKTGAAFFGAQKEMKFTIDSIYHVDVISPDVAILTGTYRLAATDTSGNTINTSPAWTYVFNKQNGEWKVVHFHESSKAK